MIKHSRVSVIPRDPIDCNQLQSLVGHLASQWFDAPKFRVGEMSNILLNIGGGVHTDVSGKVQDYDPVVSINELATQLRLWAII